MEKNAPARKTNDVNKSQKHEVKYEFGRITPAGKFDKEENELILVESNDDVTCFFERSRFFIQRDIIVTQLL